MYEIAPTAVGVLMSAGYGRTAKPHPNGNHPMGTLHHLPQRDLTPREVEIVAAYMAGKQPLAEICKLYEISPAAIGVLMAARYGCGPTAEANSRAVTAAGKTRLRLVEQPPASTATPEAPVSPGS